MTCVERTKSAPTSPRCPPGRRENLEISFQVGLLRQELSQSLGVLGTLLEKLLRRQRRSHEAPVHVLGDDVPEPRTSGSGG